MVAFCVACRCAGIAASTPAPGHSMMMNSADILILAVLVLSMLFGLWRGFISEVLSLLCWVAAFWVAWAFGDRVAVLYQPYLSQPAACLIAGYVSCFLGVLIAGALLGWLVHKLMDGGGLRSEDRVLGAVFGLARGLLLVTFVVLMAGFTAVPRDATWWRQSSLLPAFEASAGWVAQALPPEVIHYLELGGQSLPALSQVPISALQHAASKVAAPATATSLGRAAGHGLNGRVVGQ